MSVDYRPDYDPADVDSDYGHSGDITVPTFTANMKPFRFWCQKALPLVYDDSLSYYEVLCKVVKQMNDFLTDLQTATGAIDDFAQQFVINQQFLNDMADQLGQNVQDLEDYINDRLKDYMTAYTQLQDYVNNYFDNLDVQQEINNKLDEMASDGTLNDLFDPVLETWMQQKTAQIDAAIAAQDAVQAAQNGRISTLEGRMDTFDGLPAGSTAGNAELLGIRTNFLGEVYPTAGDAVRSSDMIASGFSSIPFTRLEEWNGNEESSVYDTIQFDVSAYKGGRAIMIANMEGFVDAAQMIGVAVYATNISGKNVDPSPHYYALGSNIFTNYSVIPTQIQGEERIALYFSIPDNFSYQYLKMGFVERIPVQEYTQPAAIVYATYWSRTPVDPTLTVAGAAADAKATGDAIDEVNERLYYGLDTLGLLELNPNNWETGGIYSADGSNNPYFPNRIRTKDYVPVSANDTLKFTFTDNVHGYLYKYTDSSYLGYVELLNGTQYINDAQTTRLRFVLIDTTTISKFNLLKHVAISSYYDQIGTIIKSLSTVASNINVTDANASSYSDVNDFPNRSIINVSASANIAHKPFDSCTIITTGFNTTVHTPYGGSKQIAINNGDGAIASRSHNGSAWSTWFNVTSWIPTVATLSSNVAVSSTNLSSYPNVDNFPNRSIIHILNSANVENKPFATCTVITTGFSTTGTAPYGGSKQIALSDIGSIASRSHNGTKWSAWTYSDHVYHATPSNYIEVIENALLVTDATVILESGTYNLFDTTHNEAYWKNKRPATRYCGINLKNGIKIVGDGLVKLVANYSGSDEDIKENFSVFNVAGSCEIRNINIEGTNICYLVHDDPRIASSKNNSCIIHGCKLIHNGTDHTFTSGAPMCIGAGESNNSYREYTDNIVDSTYDRSVNVHTATGGKGKYIINGNYFIRGTLGFTAFGDGTGRIEGVVSNNSFPANIVNTSSGASTPYTFNNVVRS